MFLNGGGTLKADMKDADSTALVLSTDEVFKGMRIARKGATVSQMKDRALGAAGSLAADGQEAGYDATIGAGRGVLAGTASFGGVVRSSFAPAAEKIGVAAGEMEHAGSNLLLAARSFFERKGWTREQASGLAASFNRESLLNPKARGDGGAAYGIGQWHRDRQLNFQKVFGHDIRSSTREEQLAFAQWELTHSEAGAGQKLRHASTAYDAGAAVSRYYERPADRDGEARRRGQDAAHLAAQPAIPVKVEVHLVNAPPGTKAKVTAGRQTPPAVSHAFSHN